MCREGAWAELTARVTFGVGIQSRMSIKIQILPDADNDSLPAFFYTISYSDGSLFHTKPCRITEETTYSIIKEFKIMDTRDILNKVRSGELTVEEAERYFKKQPFEEMGYAKLDTHRKIRSGFAEVIFCSGKADEHLLRIFGKLYEQNQEVFGTRASMAQYELIRRHYPQTVYDPVSRIIKIEKENKPLKGLAAICTAGTADIPVAEEAALTAEYFGTKTERIYDIGVSGLHRLLASLDTIQKANCVVAVAGMEGALASVLGGLVDKPVIAVPTSVGYGASLHGLSALLTMINSCANGIAVVNIDNGFGVGYMATQINRLATDKI